MKKESEYQVRYQKTKCYCLSLKLNKETDSDIIEYLDRLHYGGETKQGKIKELIRKDIAEAERIYQEYLDD